jgi:small subunit ribosomal protein S16
MLTIRFARVGKRNKAQFKIMLQEHTVAPGGRHIEILGNYNPHSKEANLKGDRIKYWVSKGAQLSNTVHNLLVRNGVIEAAKRKVKVPAKKVEEVVAEVKTEEKAAVEAAPVEEVKAA